MTFPYKLLLKDANFTKDNGTVFSCFACGGGSTMGYKLAGYDVIGCNEVDKKIMDTYVVNHKPKYAFLEGIQTFKNRNDLPDELYNLDILDGSPPCSSFSMLGNRSKDWGKEKKFREGQSIQIIDTLMFDFAELAVKLQSKVVLMENVKGLLTKKTMPYLVKLFNILEDGGYYCNLYLLNSNTMGVPQSRQRVFIICLRKDLAKQFLTKNKLFYNIPILDLNFNEKKIPFSEIFHDYVDSPLSETEFKIWLNRVPTDKNMSYTIMRIENKKNGLIIVISLIIKSYLH